MKKDKKNILLVFGTRPEVIKMGPVVKEFRKFPKHFNTMVCVTGQHRQMIDPLLRLFGIKVDVDLNLMRKDQTLEHITTSVLHEVGILIEKYKIDCVVVQGDTTTAMAAALAGFYNKIKVAHVEAGLRTKDKYHPYPEEINRRIIDTFADYYFAHTQLAKQNLVKEGVKSSSIDVTGNTVIDALLETATKKYAFSRTPLAKAVDDPRRLILMTAHRRENFGQPIMDICEAVKSLALEHSKTLKFIYPVHLNPNIQGPARAILGNVENVYLCEPLEYLPMVHLIKRSYLVLTDSGGLQEEAPSLGKPVLVLRQTTERPEGVTAGCVEVIGMNKGTIIRKVNQLLSDKRKYQRMSKAANPYGDGKASQRIVKRLLAS